LFSGIVRRASSIPSRQAKTRARQQRPSRGGGGLTSPFDARFWLALSARLAAQTAQAERAANATRLGAALDLTSGRCTIFPIAISIIAGAGDDLERGRRGSSQHDAIILGTGAGDVINAAGSEYDALILGNDPNDMVDASASLYDTIVLGNGAGDVGNALAKIGNPSLPGSQYDTITLGNGRADAVNLFGAVGDTVTLGNGANDTVNATPNLSDFSSRSDTITLGNGAADAVNLINSQGDTITLGNGTGDSVLITGGFPSSNDLIRLGTALGTRSILA